MIRYISLAALVLVAGCASTTTAAVESTVSKAQADLQMAITAYDIAAPIAQTLAAAVPTYAPIINLALARATPLVAQAQTALNMATTDTSSIEALVAQITAQTKALSNQPGGPDNSAVKPAA